MRLCRGTRFRALFRRIQRRVVPQAALSFRRVRRQQALMYRITRYPRSMRLALSCSLRDRFVCSECNPFWQHGHGNDSNQHWLCGYFRNCPGKAANSNTVSGNTVSGLTSGATSVTSGIQTQGTSTGAVFEKNKIFNIKNTN